MKKASGNIVLLIFFLIYLLGTNNYCFQEQVWIEDEHHQEQFSALSLPPAINYKEKDSRSGTTFRIDFYNTPIFHSSFSNLPIKEYCESAVTEYVVDCRFPIYIWVDCFRI